MLARSYVFLYYFELDMLGIVNIVAIMDLRIDGMCAVFGSGIRRDLRS